MPDQPTSRPRLNVLMLGDKRSGKSTLLGQVLLKLGVVDGGVVRQNEKDGCGDAKFAWVVDRLKEEREGRRGTVTYKQWRAVVGGFDIMFNDVPGGVKYAKNLLKVGQGCDTAIVTISSEIGEFEAHLSPQGTLRDLLTIAYSIGVKSLILAFTKMDIRSTAFSKDRYTAMCKTVLSFVQKVGFSTSSVRTIPVSGWTGDNITSQSPRMPWYEGPSLTGVLSGNIVPHRLELRSLRVPILEVYKRGGRAVAVGRVESGTVSVGSRLVSKGQRFTVDSLEARHTPVERGVAGTTVGIGFSLKPAMMMPRVGDVLGPSDDPPTPCTSFEVQILVLRTLGHLGLAPSYTPIVHIHTSSLPCEILAINTMYDRQTAVASSYPPTSLHPSQTGLITLRPTRPLCIEPFHENPSLGRVVIRDSNTLLAVGVVRHVNY